MEKMDKKNIKMIAIDLDGTALNDDKSLSMGLADAIRKADSLGIKTVVATGRVYDSVPEELYYMDEVSYFICSNGASIYEHATGEKIFSKMVEPSAVEKSVELAKETGYMFESFTGGKAYISADEFYDIKENGCPYRTSNYVLQTRTPIDDIYGFTLSHKDEIENLNFYFPTPEEKEAFFPKLSAMKEAFITSSFPSNYEVGGIGVTKGNALKYLLEREHAAPMELFAIGDSPNDISMIEMAGVGVAMGNAEEEVKKAASYMTSSNEEGGVAEAIAKYVFDRV